MIAPPVEVRRPLRLLAAVSAVALGLLLPAVPAHAVALYWDTNGTTDGSGAAIGTWGTSSFWNTDPTGGASGTFQIPTTASDDLFFSAGTNGAVGTVTVSGAQAARSITLDDNVSITISGGGPITLGSGGITVAPGANTANAISTAIVLAASADPTIQTAGTGALTISGGITGASNLVLQNNSTNAGGITIATGSLNNAGTVTNSGSGSGSVLINAVIGANVTGLANTSGTMRLANQANTFAGDVTVSGGVLEFVGNSGGAYTTANPLGTKASVYKTVFLTDNATFRVVSGTNYNVNVPTAANVGAGQVFNIGAGGATFDVAGASNYFTLDDGSGAGNAWTAAQLQGSGTLTKTGPGALRLGNNFSVFTGAIIVEQGVLQINNNTNCLGDVLAGTTINSGAAFNLNGRAYASLEPLTVSGTGISNGGVIYNNSTTGATFPGPITLAASSTIGLSNSGDVKLSGAISGPAGADLTVSGTGSGRYIPVGANTYAGDTHLVSGTAIANVDSVGSASTFNLVSGPYGVGTLYFDGGMTRATTGTVGNLVGNAVVFTADTTFVGGTTQVLTFTGPVTLANSTRTLTQQGTADVLFTGSIGGTAANIGLTVGAGSVGTIVLSGANTYTGPTTINAGTLALTSTGSLASPAVTAQSGGTFQIRGSNTIGGMTTPNITIAGGPTPASAGTLSLADGNVNTLTISSATWGATVLTMGGIASNPAQLSMDVGPTSDQIVLDPSLLASIGAGGVTLNVNPSGAVGALATGTHTLISAPGGGLSSGGGFALNTTAGNFGGKILSLSSSDTALQVVAGDGAATPGTAYFKGAVNAYWNGFSGGNANNSNWTSDAAGTTDTFQMPGATTDVHFYATGAANLATTLGQNVTIKTLTVDGGSLTGAVSIAPGGGTLTVAPASSTTGISVNAGAGAVTISAPVVLGADQTWANASANKLAVSGGITGTANLLLSGAGGFNLNTNPIDIVGTITRDATDTAVQDNVTAVIGANVTGIIQNNPNTTSSFILDGANVNYTGTTTINAGRLDARNLGATNVIEALGIGPVQLNGGTLDLRANGSGSFQTIVTGNGFTGNNVTLGGDAKIDVQRYNANTNNAIQINHLTVGAHQLDVTATNGYNLNVAGTTTIAGAATLNPTTSPLNLLGKVADNGNNVAVIGTAPTRLLNTAAGTDANVVTGTWTVDGGVLQGYAPPADALVGGSNSLGVATIALTGTNPVLRLAPDLSGGLSTYPWPGLVDKSYTGVASNAATNFLGATQPITTGAAGQNPTGNQIVSDINIATQATATTSSHQYTGLLNIFTAGVYNIRCDTDDNGSLVVDGNAAIATSNSNATVAIYLTPGLHTFSLRWNNNGGNGRAIASYQGPDTAGAMVAIPASAFSYTTPSLLAANFGNNVTLTAGGNRTIEIASDATLGSLTMFGTNPVGVATTLNVTGSNDITTLTFSGATTLTDSITVNNPTAHLVLQGGATSGSPIALTKNGFGTLTFNGAVPQLAAVNFNSGGISILRDASTNWAGADVSLANAVLTINVDRAIGGAGANGVLTVGNILRSTTPATGTLNVTGGNGYSLVAAGLALPGGTGHDTILVPGINMTIAGNVTNQMANFNTGNYDTLYLDGTSTNNVIQGNISDSPNGNWWGQPAGFVPQTGGFTRVVKRNSSTWTLQGAASTYSGITQVLGGTLKAGANDAIPLTNLQGIDVTATGASMTAAYDLNGFHQTLNTLAGSNRALNLGGSTDTSAPVVTGAGSTLTINGNVVYNAANNPQGGVINVDNLNLGGDNRTINVGLSASAGTTLFPDLTISSVVANGAITKTGAGVLRLSGANSYAGGTTISGGTLVVSAADNLGAGNVAVSGGTLDMGGTSRSLATTLLASGAIVNGSLTGAALLKQGPDVLTLSVPVIGTSTVTVNQGPPSSTANPAKISTLELDFLNAGTPSDVIDNTATLTLGGSATGLLGGGAVALKGVDGVDNGQTFASTAFSGGASALVVSAGASPGRAVLNLGPISRTSVAGTVDVTLPAGTQSAANGVVVGGAPTAGTVVTGMNTTYMTVGGNDWAAHSTDSPGNVVAASVAGPFGASIYTAYAADPSPSPFNGDADITGSFIAPLGSTVNTLRFNAGNNTLAIAAGDTLTVDKGGVLFGSGSAGATITGGKIVPGAGQELVVLLNKANTQTYSLSSEIADGLNGPTSVTYRGNVAGGTTGSIVTVAANNTYTGPTYITQGRVQVTTGAFTTPFGTGAGAIVYVDGSTDGQFFMNQNATLANDFVIVGNGFNENNTRRGAIRLDSSAANTPTLSGSITLSGDAAIGNNSAATAGMGVLSGPIGGAFTLSKVNAGTISLTNTANTHAATNLAAGVLRIAGDGSLGTVPASPATNVTFSGSATLQFANATTLDANRNILIDSGTATFDTMALASPTAIDGVIRGAGALATAGTGTLVLNAANTYAGATTVPANTVVLGLDDALPATTSVTLGNTAAGTAGGLDLSAASQFIKGLSVVTMKAAPAPVNTITIGSGETLTVAGNMTVGAAVTSGTGAFLSNLTVSGAGSMFVGAPATSTITIGVNQAATNAAYWNDATLDLTGLTGAAGFSTDVTNFNVGVGTTTQGPGTVLLTNTANHIVATTLTVGDTGSNNGRGAGTLVFGTNTNVVQADTLNIGRGKNTGPGMVKFASQTAGSPGTVVITNRAGTGAANITVADINGVGTAGGSIGTLDLRGHVATVAANTLLIGRNNGTSTGNVTGTVYFDAGTFTVNTLTMAPKTAAGVAVANAILNVSGGSFTVNPGGAFTLASQATAGSAAGTLNITGGTFTSNVSILDGGGTATTTITLDGGTLDMAGNSIGSATPIDVLNFNSGTLMNVAQINNGAALNKATAGTLVLAGTNAYTGATAVNAGILSVQSDTGLGAVSAGTSVALNATLQLQGDINVGAEALTLNGGAAPGQPGALVNAGGANSYAGAVTLAVGSSISAAAGSSLTLTGGVSASGVTATFNGAGTTHVNTGAISGAAANSNLVVDGATLNLGAASTYSGTTTVQGGGTLKSGVLDALPVGTVLTLGGAAGNTLGTFDLNGFNQTVAGLATAGTGTPQHVTNGGAGGTHTLTVNNDALTSNADYVFGGTIGNGATAATALTKAGDKKLTLSGANTYTGATTVSGGRLTLTGTVLTGSATVSAATATLELARAGGPATPVGLDVGNAGTLEVSTAGQELGDIAGTGTTNVSAGSSLTANSIVQDTLIIGAGGSLTIREVPVAASGFAAANAVPEPGTWALIGAGVLCWLVFRRRRTR